MKPRPVEVRYFASTSGANLELVQITSLSIVYFLSELPLHKFITSIWTCPEEWKFM
jgi:hypothetical protein